MMEYFLFSKNIANIIEVVSPDLIVCKHDIISTYAYYHQMELNKSIRQNTNGFNTMRNTKLYLQHRTPVFSDVRRSDTGAANQPAARYLFILLKLLVGRQVPKCRHEK